MICIVDRIEETTAVCQREDRSVFTLPLSCLPQGVKEGDVLREENGVSKLTRTKPVNEENASGKK